MSLRAFLWFTAATYLACLLLILFLDQPLAWSFHQYSAGAVPFFAAYTAIADHAYGIIITPQLFGLPALFSLLLAAFLVSRSLGRQTWGNVFLVVLLTYLASQGSANVLKGLVHRLRPVVLFEQGYAGLGLWQPGPANDSFPSGHVATFLSFFLPLALAFPRYRVPLLVLPFLLSIGRLVLSEHYVSDVWFSVWLVTTFTCLFRWLVARIKKRKSLTTVGY